LISLSEDESKRDGKGRKEGRKKGGQQAVE
jgi:hypothetical protein